VTVGNDGVKVYWKQRQGLFVVQT